jgi:HemY protein
MRKIFLLSLLALVLSVAVVALVEREPGYVLISYGNYTIETSLWVGLVIAALAGLVVYLFWRLLHVLLSGPRSLSEWFRGRRAGNAAQMTSRGMISFTEGEWSRARTQLLRGVENNESPLFNYLVAARASANLGEPAKVAEYLDAAEKTGPEAVLSVALTRARLELEAGRYEPAVATLKAAGATGRPSVRGLDLLCQAYRGAEDWQGLAALLPELKKNQLLSDTEYRSLERSVYTHLLEACAGLEPADYVDALQQQWQQVPGELKRDPLLLQSYCKLLIAAGEHNRVEKLIAKAQKQSWDAGLARVYAYVKSDDLAGQLATAENWLTQHDGEPELFLCLGRLAARNKLWGKARDYFETSDKLQRTPEVCAELGRLLASQGEERPALAYFRDGLLLEQAALPDLPMPARLAHDTHRPQPLSAATGATDED